MKNLDSVLAAEHAVSASEGEASFACPPAVSGSAVIGDVQGLLTRAGEDPAAFWGAHAQTLEWTAPWSTVSAIDLPSHRWFVDGSTNATLNALDRHVRDGRGEAPALTWLGEDGATRSFTYAEALAEVCRISGALRSIGVRKGDRVVLYMPLVPEGVFSMLACARIGAIHVAVYAGMGDGALRARIEDCEPAAVVYADLAYRRGKRVDLRAIVKQALVGLCVPAVVGLRRTEQPLPDGHHDFAALVAGMPSFMAAESMDADDPLFILYTSGTTGRPKGIVHVHGGYTVGVDWFARNFFEIGPGKGVWWSTSDIGWIVGHSYIVYGPFLAGGHQLVREGAPDWPDGGAVWRLVDQYGVTGLFTAPTLVRMYMRLGPACLSGTSRRSLRLLACAGEPLNPEAMRWARNHILSDGGDPWGHVLDNFWQTEVASPLLATFPAMAAKPGYAGRSMPTVRARIVSDGAAETSDGEVGSLVIAQPLPYMMRTIWRDPARYASVWSKTLGGYVTGDLATRDSDGYVKLLGRSDDVINTAGHRVGTAEVESSLIGNPAVAECAVIGVPDELKGEAIKAYVVVRVGVLRSEELKAALIAHVRADLGAIAQPSELDFVEALPKTRSGKIMRRVLKARTLGLDAGDMSTLDESP